MNASDEENDDRKQFPNESRHPAYFLALVLTAFQTLPFVGLVASLSEIPEHKFLPCSDHSCTFMSIGNFDGLHPSTLWWYQNPYLTVKNGNASLHPASDGYLSPLCPGNTSASMIDFCTTHAAKGKIVNVLVHGYFHQLYTWCCWIWFASKVLHDWLLLLGVAEHVTIKIGILSLLFEICAATVCFAWCFRVTAVFVAPLGSANCACYYILPDLESVLALSTPVVLLVLTIFKTEKILRSAMFGDILYFIKYEVPYYIADKSLRQPMDIYIIDRTVGTLQCERTPNHIRVLSTQQLAQVAKIFTWIVFPCEWVSNLLIALSLGPIGIRLFELLNRTQTCQAHAVSALFIVISTNLMVYSHLSHVFHICSCTLKERIKVKPTLGKAKTIFRHVAYSVLMSGSQIVLLNELRHACFHRDCEQSQRATLGWTLSVSVYMLVLFGMLYDSRTSGVWKTLQVKAGISEMTPDGYLELAAFYPEYGLDEEKLVAEKFLTDTRTIITPRDTMDFGSRKSEALSQEAYDKWTNVRRNSKDI